MQTMFSSSSSCSPIYVAHHPLWLYVTLLPRNLWRHKRKRFINLMNHMKEVFLAAHLFHCYVVQLYLFVMCCLFSCVLLDVIGSVLLDVIGYNILNNHMHECKLLFHRIHILFFHVLWLFLLWDVSQWCVYFDAAISDRVLCLFNNATNV